MSRQRALQYYGRWLRLTFDPANRVFKSARNFVAFVTPLALIVVTPVLNKYYPFLGPRMSEIALYAPLVIVFVILPVLFLSAPYRMHEEQEQKIESLNRELQNRAIRQAQCEAIAALIDEGNRVRALYAEGRTLPTTDEAGMWLTKVRGYLEENLGHVSVVQWENEEELSLPQSPEDKFREARAATARPILRGLHFLQSERAKVYQTLSFRLIRLHELLTRLQG